MVKNRFSELGRVSWIIILCVIVGLAALGWYAFVYPQQLAIQRNAVEQSKSYNDANNIALGNYIVQYESPNASEGQQKAILNAMCEMTLKMKSELVSPRITKFLELHGGCE